MYVTLRRSDSSRAYVPIPHHSLSVKHLHNRKMTRANLPERTLKNRLKIAQIVAPAPYGGLESVVAGLSAGLLDAGHEVVLLLVLDLGVSIPEWALRLKQRGAHVEALAIPPRAYRFERRRVISLLLQHGIDVVHTHGYRTDVVDGSAAQRAGFPVVSTAHGFVRNGFRSRLYSILQIRALRRFGAVIAVSAPLRNELARAGADRSRLELIPNALIRGDTAPLRRSEAQSFLSLPSAGKTVGWVGRISAEKGPDVAIHAFALLGDPSTRLCVIGDGPLLKDMRLLAAGLGVGDRVTFAGAVADAHVYFSAFDLLLLSSHTEGTPMVALEAAAARLPIVATAVGGVPSLIGDDGGWLVPANNPQALAEALRTALREPTDAKQRIEILCGRLKERSAEWVQLHSSLYQRVLRAATSRPS